MTSDLLAELTRAAAAADGQPPFSDQSLVDATTGVRRVIRLAEVGAALVTVATDPTEAELVIHPDARRRRHGEQLLRDVITSTSGTLLVWAHGDHPGARVLASRHGFEAVRTLLQLRAEVAASPELSNTLDSTRAAPRHTTRPAVIAFRPGIDDDAWLDLNAKAFAGHPEQGKMTQRDLDARKAEPWFDDDDFLLLWHDDDLAGFCWLKVADGIGEFYVVGVDPARQGQGIGRQLVQAGLTRLAERGIRTAALYVEADNGPAVHLYRSYGFSNHTIDVQYRLHR